MTALLSILNQERTIHTEPASVRRITGPADADSTLGHVVDGIEDLIFATKGPLH